MKRVLMSLMLLSISLPVMSKDSNSDFTYSEICKAGISTSVFRSPKGIKTVSSNGIKVEISYTRDDGNKYTYNCIVDSKEILWKDQTMSGWNKNVKLFYKVSIDGKSLTIDSEVFGDTISKSYKKSDF